MRERIANFCWGVVKHWKVVVPILLALIVAGFASYIRLLPREGFPSVQFPLTLVNVTSIGTDAETLDEDIAQPLYQALESDEEVDTIQTTARDNFLVAVVFFQESVDPEAGAQQVEDVFDDLELPPNSEVEFIPVNPAQYLNQYDALISVYARDGQSIAELEERAQAVADQLQELPEIESSGVEELNADVTNPRTGEVSQQQVFFNQIGVRENGELEFFPSITVGVVKSEDIDIVEMSEVVQESLDEQSTQADNQGYGMIIGADFAEVIQNDISNLVRNLSTGILAVVAVTLLLISLRASLITAVFMVSVVLVTMFALLLLGYTLNVITLFALVLTLGLFVDDATIMVEAIDAERGKLKDRRSIIKAAAKKVASASFAGTLTTVLVFAPLVFIGGILGTFIRVMPITIIVALFISYAMSLLLVPLMARFTILRNLAAKRFGFNLMWLEHKLSQLLADSIRWLKTRPVLGGIWASAMLALSVAMFWGGIVLAGSLEFNIFPPSKDAEQLQVTIDYKPGTTLEEAEELASEINAVVDEEIGEHVVRVVYGGFTLPNERTADLVIQLTPVDERSGDDGSPGLIAKRQP